MYPNFRYDLILQNVLKLRKANTMICTTFKVVQLYKVVHTVVHTAGLDFSLANMAPLSLPCVNCFHSHKCPVMKLFPLHKYPVMSLNSSLQFCSVVLISFSFN